MVKKIKEPVITYDQAESMARKVSDVERSGNVSYDYYVGFSAACAWLSGDCTLDIKLKDYVKETFEGANKARDLAAILELVFGEKDE